MRSCMTHEHVDLSIQVDFEEPLQFGEEAGDSSKAVVEALQKALNAVTCIFIFLSFWVGAVATAVSHMACRFFLQGGQTDYDKRVSSGATAGMFCC